VQVEQHPLYLLVKLFARRNRLAMGIGAFALARLAIFPIRRESQFRRVQLERDKTRAIRGNRAKRAAAAMP
jgi:hypothetical protein